jgi:hypothetical protein
MPEMKFPPNQLSAFETGALMSLKARMALELLKAPMFEGFALQACLGANGPEQAATIALAIAGSLLEQGQASGDITEIPEGDDLNNATRDHIARNMRAQAVQQVNGQRIMEQEAPRVHVKGMLNG